MRAAILSQTVSVGKREDGEDAQAEGRREVSIKNNGVEVCKECGKFTFEDNSMCLFCSFCGAPGPAESVQDGLHEIFDEHRGKYKNGKDWQEAIMVDLRKWKAGHESVTDCNQLKEPAGEKAGELGLWEAMREAWKKCFYADQSSNEVICYKAEAKAALDWLAKRMPPEKSDDVYRNYAQGWNAYRAEVMKILGGA